MFIKVILSGLFIIMNIIGVNPLFKFNHCKPMDPVKRTTYCFFDYKQNETINSEEQSVTLCFKPKTSFSKLLVHHFQVKEPASYEIYSDFFETDKWNFLNVTIIFRKGITASNNSTRYPSDIDNSDTIQYIFNGKPDKELSLPKTLNIFEFNVGFTFLGEIEGTLDDLQQCLPPPTSPPSEENGLTVTILIIVCVVSLLISGIFAAFGIVQFKKASSIRNRPPAKKHSYADASMQEGKVDARRLSSYGSYVNQKDKNQSKPEYEEGQYEDDTYEEPPNSTYMTIEEKARKLNKSVIELHFGM